MDTLVQAEQLEAIVGKENTGLLIFTPRHFPVSVDFPPPMAKIISAFITAGFSISFSTFSYVASPPYHKKSIISMEESFTASNILSLAAAKALCPPIATILFPYLPHISGISL